MEVPRPSGELGFMAIDVDLNPSSQWYAQTPDVPPPSLQNRNDLLFEIESSTSSKRGGKTTISKDIYVLYMDYSQTVITASFDAADPTNVTLEQRHERPPPPPRQDQLEAASSQFGSHIASSIPSKANTTIGDGTPHALILSLLYPLSTSVLRPVGTRAYGAPVYSNLANASTQQFDEIRPGDIVTFRNAKFAGHQGKFHTRYTVEVGKPDHVAVVADWDGTKKKIRVWEQRGKEGGKEAGKAKVKEESYRVVDLKSGEVRVWRVMGRAWVGWEGGTK
jgi:myosin tail region-interacting protein MTI1